MPRPRRDGTTARNIPNKRKLSDAFVRTVRPDPERVTVYWDTFQRGLALTVQPSGHLAFKCVYTVRGRGARWYHLGDGRAISVTHARKLTAEIMYKVATGTDPHADRLALRNRGTFAEVAGRYVREYAQKRNKSWRHVDALVTKRPGEVTHLHRAHIVDERWWVMPGAPDPATNWPGTKNGQSHWVWLSEPVMELLPDVLSLSRWYDQMPREMRDICTRLGVSEKVTPHDLRRTFCSTVTALGFGREAMNRLTNHKEGGIADVYDRHGYRDKNKEIMEAVARHIMMIAEGRSNVVAMR
jgi:integrase